MTCLQQFELMEKNIDKEISAAEVQHLQQINHTLNKQNQLLKNEVQQLKDRQNKTNKELNVYKKIVFQNNQDNELLQLQHQRIFELQTQLDTLQAKYSRMLKSGGSNEQTQYALKCKQYQRRLQQTEMDHQKQLTLLKDRLMKQNASEIVQSKRTVTTPSELKKSSLAVRKFV